MAKLQITCATEGAEIRYTVDGSDPTLQSDLYTAPIEASGTVKAKAWKEGMLSSEVSTYSPPSPPVVGDKLSDGSTICYDRGEQYGTYAIEGGDLVKKDEGSDWRYIVCEEYDLNHYEPDLGTGDIGEYYVGKPWGDPNHNDDQTHQESIGSGEACTNWLINAYANTNKIWAYVSLHRTDSGKNWFVPCFDELMILYENKDLIGNFDIYDFSGYASSNEVNTGTFRVYDFKRNFDTNYAKDTTDARVRCIRYI